MFGMDHSIVKEIHNPLFVLVLRSDGIVELRTTDDAYFTIVEARQYLDALREITGGVPRPILKVPGKHANIDNETRIIMASAEGLQYSLVEAVVIRSLAQRIIGNFYIKFDRPVKPVRLFTNKAEAEKWLLSHK